jgi:hypothetical protein
MPSFHDSFFTRSRPNLLSRSSRLAQRISYRIAGVYPTDFIQRSAFGYAPALQSLFTSFSTLLVTELFYSKDDMSANKRGKHKCHQRNEPQKTMLVAISCSYQRLHRKSCPRLRNSVDIVHVSKLGNDGAVYIVCSWISPVCPSPPIRKILRINHTKLLDVGYCEACNSPGLRKAHFQFDLEMTLSETNHHQ